MEPVLGDLELTEGVTRFRALLEVLHRPVDIEIDSVSIKVGRSKLGGSVGVARRLCHPKMGE